MKICIHCKAAKPLSGFHLRKASKDGHRADCKRCHMKRKAAYFARPEVQSRRKQYSKSHRYKAVKKKYLQSEKGLAASRKHARLWYRTEKGRAYRSKYSIEWRKTRRGQLSRLREGRKYATLGRGKIYLRVFFAVKKGKIQKAPCAVCGKPKVHAHHEDYNKPLAITWLCAQHHAQRHNEIRTKQQNRRES